jgi:hypothetical protein
MRVATVQQISNRSVVRALMGLNDTVNKWWPKRHSKTVISINHPEETFGDFARAQIREALQARRELKKNYIIIYDEKYSHPTDLPNSSDIPFICSVPNPTAVAA